MKNLSALLAFALFVAAYSYLIHEDAEAMKKCRETQSEETCFYQLNR